MTAAAVEVFGGLLCYIAAAAFLAAWWMGRERPLKREMPRSLVAAQLDALRDVTRAEDENDAYEAASFAHKLGCSADDTDRALDAWSRGVRL